MESSLNLTTPIAILQEQSRDSIPQTVSSTTNPAAIDFNLPLNESDYNRELDIEIMSTKPLTGKQYLLVIPITKFFKKLRNLYILINILNGRSVISLRLIEYFVVNYVLENNTYYNLEKYKHRPDYIINNLFAPVDNNEPATVVVSSVGNPPIRAGLLAQTPLQSDIRTNIINKQADNFDNYFLIHDNYKCQLKEYNKKNFDPFCRWTRIRMYYDKSKYFFTTVAQLNFFKWAIENYILDYILDNLQTIEKSMNDYEKAIKKEKKIRKLNLQTLACDVPVGKPSTTSDIITTVAGSLTNPTAEGCCKPVLLDESSASTSASASATIAGGKPSALLTGNNKITLGSNSAFTGINLNLMSVPVSTVCTGLLGPNSISLGMGKDGRNTSALSITPMPLQGANSLVQQTVLDKKTKIKGRKKKEFTKTNRSILKYDCTKIINFD